MDHSMRFFCAAALAAAPAASSAAPVTWVDWLSGTPGANGNATGVLNLGGTTVDVNYSGEIAFLQTSGGTNYFIPSAPYMSSVVDNAPASSDIIALSTATTKTLTFSQPVDNLFFAVVSLNGNGYRFNQDFEIISSGTGYWGPGTMSRVDLGNGTFEVTGTGEPHGVIRFNEAVSSITWSSQTNEYWNGFTVGTFGLADGPGPVPIPEPETYTLTLAGLAVLAALTRRRKAWRK
jgi:hypothetical protein